MIGAVGQLSYHNFDDVLATLSQALATNNPSLGAIDDLSKHSFLCRGNHMTATYNITEEDIYAFNHYSIAHVPLVKANIRTTGFTFLLFAFLLGIIFLITHDNVFVFVSLFGLTALSFSMAIYILVFSKYYIGNTLKGQIKKGVYQKLLGRQSLTPTAQQLHLITRYSETNYRWGGIDSIELNDTHMFLFVSAAQAIIVPSRAFESKALWQTFVDEVKEHHSRAIQQNLAAIAAQQ
ncbi:YcxB family protein [Chloroflexia bacterium SDU3-3]|nr:YcxB family protein [Chloroflexia bacterium SDU3-3]